MFKAFSFLILIMIVLSHPDSTFKYAYQGLYNWASRIVPTLFPYMMISSLMIYSGADIELGNILGKFFRKIYRFSNYGIYAVFMGFFCGFPMGAKVVSELYSQNKITKKEAAALLAFCNNIGPAYFTGIIIPVLYNLGCVKIFPFIFGMYGIPAIYGIIISQIHYGKTVSGDEPDPIEDKEANLSKFLPSIIKKSCIENTQSIIILGGYITFTNAFRILLDLIPLETSYKNILSAFIELTGGVQLIYQTGLPPELKTFWIMTALSFSGLSCFLQTSSFIEKTGLSTINYMKHKIASSIISAVYYLIVIKLL